MTTQTISQTLKNNDLDGGERWTPVPSPPPNAPAKAFSRSGCGRIFFLFSSVIREGLSAGPGATWPGSGLSGQIFSGPHDCSDLVNSLSSGVVRRIPVELGRAAS